jgi:hypothetical protein
LGDEQILRRSRLNRCETERQDKYAAGKLHRDFLPKTTPVPPPVVGQLTAFRKRIVDRRMCISQR